MFMEEDVLVPAGFAPEPVVATDSQLPPLVVVALVKNETASPAGFVVNVTFCVKGIVEPSGAEGVQDAGLGITEGGGVPVATKVALLRLNLVGELERVMVTNPVTLVDGNAAGTAVIMFPSGIVTLAVSVARLRRLQLSMTSASGASTLSVRATVTVEVVAQASGPRKVVKFTFGPSYVLVDAMFVVAELAGAIVWLMEVVAENLVPSSEKGSPPLTKFNVPVRL
jgi:hypothetical protein